MRAKNCSFWLKISKYAIEQKKFHENVLNWKSIKKIFECRTNRQRRRWNLFPLWVCACAVIKNAILNDYNSRFVAINEKQILNFSGANSAKSSKSTLHFRGLWLPKRLTLQIQDWKVRRRCIFHISKQSGRRNWWVSWKNVFWKARILDKRSPAKRVSETQDGYWFFSFTSISFAPVVNEILETSYEAKNRLRN